MSDLSARIKDKRERERLSLREAGAASGVAFATLGRIEKGAEPSYSIVRKIEAWLDGLEPVLPPPPMSLRDWFAGQALAGLAGMSDSTGTASWLASDAANRAYEYADAMMAARQQNQRGGD